MRKFLVKAVIKIKEATLYSISGLKAVFQDELAFRIELLGCSIAIPAAFFLGNSAIERAVLISPLILILVTELLNSALEATLNRVSLDWNPLIKKAKDAGSAAVMLTIINVVIVWVIILAPHYYKMT